MPPARSNEEEIPKRLDKETINQFPLIRFHDRKSRRKREGLSKIRLKAEETTRPRVDIECKPNFKRGPNNPPALCSWRFPIKLSGSFPS